MNHLLLWAFSALAQAAVAYFSEIPLGQLARNVYYTGLGIGLCYLLRRDLIP